MIAVVASREDPASLTIREALLRAGDWREQKPAGDWAAQHRLDAAADEGDVVLTTFEEMHLYLDGVDERLTDGLGEEPSLVVFASRHSGDTGPLLSAHFTGNWGAAEYGGRDRSLARPAPAALRRVVRRLDDLAPEPFEIAVEATHHGPTELDAPSLYAELGSGPEEWEREDGADALAGAILALAEPAAEEDAPSRTVIAVGEPHYGPRVTRVALETDAAVGHVVPDWALDDLDGAGDPLLERAVAIADADAALLAGDAAERLDADALPVPVVTEGELRRRSGVPDPVAEAVRGALGDVESGSVALTERAAEGGVEAGDVERFGGVELVRAARRVDRERADAALDDRALGSAEDADGVATAVAVAAADREELVAALADVLRASYDDVAVGPDQVVATRERFDPAAARERGVPEGPQFGRLAEGETVEIDGEAVDPEDVTTTERERFTVSSGGSG